MLESGVLYWIGLGAALAGGGVILWVLRLRTRLERAMKETRAMSVRDVTERKASEEQRRRAESDQDALQTALEKSARDWEITFGLVDTPILVLDARGDVLRANRAALDILPGGFDGVPLAVEEFPAAEPWATVAGLVRQARRHESPATRTIKDAATGRIWESEVRFAPGTTEAEGRIIAVVREVTRLVELQQSLLRNESMTALGGIVAGVAHEVRNPLFTISASLDAFEARFASTPDVARYVSVLRTGVGRLSALMEQLLDYGRPAPPFPTPGPVHEVVDQALESLEIMARTSGVRLRRQVSPCLPCVVADKARTVQALRNLLENAVQHSPAGGEVGVRADRVEAEGRAWIECRVSDRGPGIAEGDLPHIFEPFFSHRQGGTGLGLAIARRIVEQQGGSIYAVNNPEGGATIGVRLPVQCDLVEATDGGQQDPACR